MIEFCTECLHEQKVNETDIYKDGLGDYAICEKCDKEFTV